MSEEPAAAVGWREAAAACGLLLLLILAAYGNVVFAGDSLIYTDNFNPLDYRPLPQNYGPDYETQSELHASNLAGYSNFHDAGATWWQWEPGGEFLEDALRRGEWPLWDPYVGGGAPAMANLTHSFFFPPYLLVVALGNDPLLKNIYFLLILLSAAFFSYLLLRKHHLTREASFAGAVAVLFCGGLNQNVGSFIGQAAACLPPALFLTWCFLDRPTWKRAALLAVGYAVLALASFPPMLLAAFGLSALYAGVLIATGEDRVRLGARYLAAVALSLGLVAFCYVPAFAVMDDVPQVQGVYSSAGMESIRWVLFSELLSPVLMGGGDVWADPPMPNIGVINFPYLGLVAVLLAGLAGPVGPRKARLFFVVIAVAAVLIVLKMAAVEPVHSLGRLPGLRSIHFAHYFGVPLNFLLAFAAAIGLERLLAGKVSRARVGVIALGLANVVGLMLVVAKVRGTLAHARGEDWMERWHLLLALLVISAGAALLLAGREPSPWQRRAAGFVLVTLLAVEGGINTFYPRQDRWDVWDHPVPYVKALMEKGRQGRIYTAGALNANAASAFELYQLDSLMTFNAPRMFDLYKRYASPGAYLFLREATLVPPDGVLDAANVRLLAIREAYPNLLAEAEQRGYRKIYADDYVRVYERETEPRYYFTSHYRRLPREEVLPALAERRARRELLVEEAPPIPAAPNDGREPPVVVEKLERNRVVLRVRAPRPGLVYCSESFFPGWRATVNGRPAPILAANYAFRAVPVPAGGVVVELRYWPPGLTAGLALSFAAALATLLLALPWNRLRRS